MYCKKCGHKDDSRIDPKTGGAQFRCPQCGALILTTSEITKPADNAKFRWKVPIVTAIISITAFVVIPRVFFPPNLETLGPTNKLKFLRVLDHSEYKRMGQTGFRVDEQTLIVTWDERWNTLDEAKQQNIVRIVGRGWQTAGGEQAKFRLTEGEDEVASYEKGEVKLGPSKEPEQ